MNEIPPRFEPLRSPPRSTRIAVLLTGPVLWLVAFLIVAYFVKQLNAVGLALLITAVSFAVSVPLLLLARRRRVADERKASRSITG